MTGMFSWQYVVSGDPAAARAIVQSALEKQGFRVETVSNDEWRATQGVEPSFVDRLLTNAHSPVVLTVRFAAAPTGLSVELHRPAFAGTGGFTRNPTQLAALDKAYREAAAAVHARLSVSGILLSARE